MMLWLAIVPLLVLHDGEDVDRDAVFSVTARVLGGINVMNDNMPMQSDQKLIEQSLHGDREALVQLLQRHRPWVYNLAFRMVMVHQDAEDVTQEIMIKLLTKLSSYDPSKASFRTWLYRIVANHVINMKVRGHEKAITDFDTYYGFIAKTPDQDPGDAPEVKMAMADLTIACVMGTLLCLDRVQRIAFILTVGFNVTSEQGAEILDMSPAAFRKTLSRARAKLHTYMQRNCGVANPEAPCRCSSKIKAFIDAGAYSASKLDFVRDSAPAMRELVGDTMERFDNEIWADYVTMYRSHPFYQPSDATEWLRELIERPAFRETFRLDDTR